MTTSLSVYVVGWNLFSIILVGIYCIMHVILQRCIITVVVMYQFILCTLKF